MVFTQPAIKLEHQKCLMDECFLTSILLVVVQLLKLQSKV